MSKEITISQTEAQQIVTIIAATYADFGTHIPDIVDPLLDSLSTKLYGIPFFGDKNEV